LKESGLWEKLQHIPPVPATEEQILLTHTKRHFDFVADCSRRGSVQIDPDTHVSSDSFQAALYAAGSAIRAVDGIMNNEFKNAFAAVRPPGHHATPNRAMGFCLFNNIAIAARYAVQKHGLQRVLIMDWDVHHGNGTQDIFYEDPSVIYISLHKKYHYPGTGWADEKGEGKAAGTKINVPIDSDDPAFYEERFQETLKRAAAFEPQFIFISCGFDAHERDPLGNLGLTNETYARLTDHLIQFASQFGHGRILSILEGGYDYSALAEAGSAHVSRLLENAS
jgi:acetoin utilization deacetylase AcuC-like enzyme